MIISVHLPKTGGTSFERYLQQTLPGKVKLDYFNSMNRDEVLSFSKELNWWKRRSLRSEGFQVIHGHFYPCKYQRFKKDRNTKFIIWLRDPIERLLSTYYFWKRYPEVDIDRNSFKKKIIEENWDEERFCTADKMQNSLTNWLWNWPIRDFDFVGLTEYFEEDIVFFNKTFIKNHQPLNIPKLNYNPTKKHNYAEELDSNLYKRLQAFHQSDYAIYNEALMMRKEREMIH